MNNHMKSWYEFIDSIYEDTEQTPEASYNLCVEGVQSFIEDLMRKAFDAGYNAAEKEYKK